MIQKLLVLLIHFGPKTKRWFWRVWYNIFAKKAYSHDFFFMNYGFYDENLFIKMDPEEERERYPVQLYHHAATQENISKKKVLEVGSGKGGGASYVSRHLKPKSVVGIDISKNAVKLCNPMHQYPNLSFCVGDLEKIREKDITSFVINALKKMSKERKEKIKKHVPRPIQPVFMSYAGIQGSEVYNSFIQNRLVYKSATFKKIK